MKKRLGFSFSTTQIILLSFIAVIFAGSILLSLPVSAADGIEVSYIDALFTATTATCVTGLVTVTTATTWSYFGQAVILMLIQIGGLGVITVVSGFMIALHKKMYLSDRLLIQDAFNLNTLAGLSDFIKKVIKGTFIVEGIGALLYMLVFVPEFGIKGVWVSVFTAVSAFCNAGMDVIGDSSLYNYATDGIVNFVTMALIVIGGIGFIVWWDFARVFKDFRKKKFKCLSMLTLHSKMVVVMTSVLILTGAAAFFAFEYDNPLTMGECSLLDKMQISLFQSVTTRTAGFASVSQLNLTDSSAIVSILLMFIGGSPVGTAGGVKTVTLAVLLSAAVSTFKNRNEVSLFNRNIAKASVYKAIAVTVMSFSIMFLSTVLLSAVTNASALDVVYETASATATVGLSRDLTPLLNFWGKIIIIATMYFGRVGPISLAIAFNVKSQNQNIIKNPTEEISVG